MWVTLEGGDAVGKSTQALALQSWLTELGRTVTLTREPGGTAVGRAIRELVLHGSESVVPRAEALLYAADRAQHVAAVVRPALQRGEDVVQDRYLDSSVAYQGAGRTLDPDEVRGLSRWATDGLLPDLTLLLDLDPREGRARRADRSDDRLEAEADEFHDRVRRAFLDLAAAEPGRIAVIDAARPVDEVQRAIRTAVTPLLDR